VTFSSLISNCEAADDWLRAESVWEWMGLQGVAPDVSCYNSMIHVYEKAGQVRLRAWKDGQTQTCTRPARCSGAHGKTDRHRHARGRWQRCAPAVRCLRRAAPCCVASCAAARAPRLAVASSPCRARPQHHWDQNGSRAWPN
jgi:hypothetical protein